MNGRKGGRTEGRREQEKADLDICKVDTVGRE